MQYKVVTKAVQPPGKCLLTGDIDGPFVDTGTWTGVTDAHMYFHVPAVEALGRTVGMVPREQVEELRRRLDEQNVRIETLRGEIEAFKTLENLERAMVGEKVPA